MINSPKVEEPSEHWAHLKEAGSYTGLRILLGIYTLFGRRIFTLVMYPLMLYFMFSKSVARRASLDFLRTHYQVYPDQWRKKPGYIDIYRHFVAFGQVVLDKVLAWRIELREDEFLVENQSALQNFLDDERGQLIIGTHFGNLEYCRGFMQRYKSQVVNVLLYDRHAANFVKIMQRINASSRMHIYQVDQLDVSTILKLKAKIDQGEWLFIAGDRIPLSGHERTVKVKFFGRDAQLPIGPYMLAKTLGCPVRLMFSYKLQHKVKFEVVPFAEKVDLPRRDRNRALGQYAQVFASELEKQCRQAPLQWFNFYDYWQAGVNEINSPD